MLTVQLQPSSSLHIPSIFVPEPIIDPVVKQLIIVSNFSAPHMPPTLELPDIVPEVKQLMILS